MNAASLPCMAWLATAPGADPPHVHHQCNNSDALHLGEHTCRTCAQPFVGRMNAAVPPTPRHELTRDLSAVTEQFRPVELPPRPPLRERLRRPARDEGPPVAPAEEAETLRVLRRTVLEHTDRLRHVEDLVSQLELSGEQRWPFIAGAIEQAMTALDGQNPSMARMHLQRAMRYLGERGPFHGV